MACPLGAIFSATLMLRESFGLERESQFIEDAVDRVLAQGYRTADIAETGSHTLGSSEFTEKIRAQLQAATARGFSA